MITPVLIAVGEARGRASAASAPPGIGVEPSELILTALRQTGVESRLLAAVDTVLGCNVASWNYRDLAHLVAQSIGAEPSHTFNSPVGGHWPARLLDEAAQRIAQGRSRIALVFGGEAQASVTRAMKSGVDLVADRGWSSDPGGPPAFDADQLGSPAMHRAGLITPARVYPLFENRFSHDVGHDIEAGAAWSASLYSKFSEISAANPTAWNGIARSAEDIGSISSANRMICKPYPLSMNAMPFVDQAVTIILTSLEVAAEFGVPAENLVYPWGGAGADDDPDVLARNDFGRSAAMASALDRTLSAAGVTADQLDMVDVYSCFPIVPKLAAHHLGLGPDTVPSVTGGHSSFGGPLNSYSLHAVAAMVRHLRGGAGLGLVLANGGYLTYQHAVLLADRPHPEGYVGDPEPVSVAAVPSPLGTVADGPVTIETATMEYGRDALPRQAFLLVRNASGERIAAHTPAGDQASAAALSQFVNGRRRDLIDTEVTLAVDENMAVTISSSARDAGI